MNTATDYWFTIEPYVYVCATDKCALLYNSLDGVTLESDNTDVIVLLKEMLREENCGVTLLKNERYNQNNINAFIRELREKYMGDIIDVTFSKGKPVQILPYVNFFSKRNKKYIFGMIDNILDTLSEISIHIDQTTDLTKLIPILKSLPDDLTFDIKEDLEKANDLLPILDLYSLPKKIICSYTNPIVFDPVLMNNIIYKVSVHFPVDWQLWNESRQLLLNQDLSFEYVFNVTSLEDCREIEQLIEEYQIEKYQMKPVFTGDNISFFEENVFLTREDILSTSISLKDFFSKQSINLHDFGKINIMPNGDVFANINHPALGNIYTHSILEIVQKELERGNSWLRIRNQGPCNTCIYQWLCPSPSDYEIAIGRPNLCHVNI